MFFRALEIYLPNVLVSDRVMGPVVSVSADPQILQQDLRASKPPVGQTSLQMRKPSVRQQARVACFKEQSAGFAEKLGIATFCRFLQ